MEQVARPVSRLSSRTVRQSCSILSVSLPALLSVLAVVERRIRLPVSSSTPEAVCELQGLKEPV